MTIDTTADGVFEGLPKRHIDAFLEHLRTAGYVGLDASQKATTVRLNGPRRARYQALARLADYFCLVPT